MDKTAASKKLKNINPTGQVEPNATGDVYLAAEAHVGCLEELTMSRRIHVNGAYSSDYAILETLVFRTASIDVEVRLRCA